MKEKLINGLKSDLFQSLIIAAVLSRLDVIVFIFTFLLAFACFAIISIIIAKTGANIKRWQELIIKYALFFLIAMAFLFFSAR